MVGLKRRLYDTSDVPNELWSLIGSFASRQTVARLCSVSQHFYLLFSSSLYSNTVDLPLTAPQSVLLIRTLATGTDSKSISITKPSRNHPHPASLIKQLGLVDRYGDKASKEKTEIVKALKQPALANGLRTLHWNLVAGVDELGRIMGVPGAFPNLKELFVSSGGDIKNFNFVHIPQLEVLRVKLDFYDSFPPNWDYRTADRLCFKFAESIQMLPSSSPLLHSLCLDITITLNDDEFPFDGYLDLVAAINSIHLPALTSFHISVDLIPPDFYESDPTSREFRPDTDLSTFLASHPNISQLALNVLGTVLSEEVVHLSRIRSFTGTWDNAVFICSDPRQPQQLTLKLVHDDLFDTSITPPLTEIRLPVCHSLTHLQIHTFRVWGTSSKETSEVSPASFLHLASSFPNLVHLDLSINRPLENYRDHFTVLTKLQSLRVHHYRARSLLHYKRPAKEVFPPDAYIEEFSFIVPSLPTLTRVQINLAADILPASTSCYHLEWDWESNSEADCSVCRLELEDLYCDRMFEPPDVKLEYSFSVLRPPSGAYLVLDSAHVEDRHSTTKK
ncbi:hypothetical protein R3P38DRAFT_2842395 [Favolaschia claudopus]|uniref:F-box domain-containing protein n=1 Tax=Favolaschia claudopus TaxID=2862362 RepID=A0AAW0E0H3_9AGAR